MKLESTCPFMKNRDLKMDTGRTDNCGKWRENAQERENQEKNDEKKRGLKFVKRMVQFKQTNKQTYAHKL